MSDGGSDEEATAGGGGGRGAGKGGRKGAGGKGAGGGRKRLGVEEGESFFDAQKKEMAERAAATAEALKALDPATRATLAGYPAGTYVRLRLSGGLGRSVF